MFVYIEKIISGNYSLQFLDRFKQLYDTYIFRNFLDFILTVAKKQELRIEISKRVFFDEELGFCQTKEVPCFDKILKKITRKKYFVRFNVITSSVIIHEFAHLIEKALDINIRETFLPIIYKDFEFIEKANIVLKEKLKNLFVNSLNLYEESYKTGEIFARYFELYASTSDISGKESIYISDIDNIFINTKKWMLDFNNLLISNTDLEIIEYSKKHKILFNLQKNFSHKYTEYNNLGKKWSKRVPSYLGDDNIKKNQDTIE